MKTHQQTVLLSGQALLTLLRAVQEHGAACRLCVSGMSMWPSIRHNDLVTIAPLQRLLPCRGEVVAFHHPENNKLVIHRVLRVNGEIYEIKGDNNLDSDGPIPLSHILGRIVKVERNGRAICWLDRRRHPWWDACYYRYALLISGCFHWIAGAWLQGILHCQASCIYRRLAPSLIKLTEDAVDYLVEIGMPDDSGVMMYCQVNTGHTPFISTLSDAFSPVQQWRMHLRLHGRGTVMLTFQADRETGSKSWLLVDVYTRIRYRGLGLERLIIRQAKDLLARSGAQEIHLPRAKPRELVRWMREGYLSQLTVPLTVADATTSPDCS